MAFRNKLEIIGDSSPDIAIIQECEDKICLDEYRDKIRYNDIYWYGDNKNKGICIFTFGKYTIRKLMHNENYKYIIPVVIENEENSVVLFAVWTQLINRNIYESYVVQAARAIKYYNKLLENENVLLIGDFNSNSIWDNESSKEYNHKDMVEMLSKESILSVYHVLNNEEHGKEKIATLYLQRKNEKPYHIDYCFCKKDMIKKIKRFEIGKYENYIDDSDHMPMFIEFEN